MRRNVVRRDITASSVITKVQKVLTPHWLQTLADLPKSRTHDQTQIHIQAQAHRHILSD